MTYEEALAEVNRKLELAEKIQKTEPSVIEYYRIVKEAVEKQIPERQSDHFYLDEYGYYCCEETDKVIRYPLVSLVDLEFCPRCGKRLTERSEEK